MRRPLAKQEPCPRGADEPAGEPVPVRERDEIVSQEVADRDDDVRDGLEEAELQQERIERSAAVAVRIPVREVAVPQRFGEELVDGIEPVEVVVPDRRLAQEQRGTRADDDDRDGGESRDDFGERDQPPRQAG